MIVCSCNVIARQEIEDVIVTFLRDDPWQLITAGKVYHAMQKRGKCCSCFPRVIDLIVSISEDFHRRMETPEAQIIPFIAAIRTEHERCETARELVRSAKAARIRRAA